MRMLLALCLLMAPLGAADAQSMPVATFLAKADALKKKGPLALLSSDIGLLKAEITNSAKQIAEEQSAAQKAGRKPATCIAKGKFSLSSDELLAHFQAIPPAQRGITVKAATAGLMRKKYPCPA